MNDLINDLLAEIKKTNAYLKVNMLRSEINEIALENETLSKKMRELMHDRNPSGEEYDALNKSMHDLSCNITIRQEKIISIIHNFKLDV